MDTRPTPRISANKLSEYMTCSPARRRRIIYDAKHPAEFIALRYGSFYDLAPAYAVSRPLDDNIIANGIERILAEEARSEWDRENAQLNTDLLQRVLDLRDHLDIDGYNGATTGDRTQSVQIGEVEVSVRPEVLLRKTVRNQPVLGALKFYLPKSYPLNEVSGSYLASLVKWYLETEFPAEDSDCRHCFVFDVPNGSLYSAPSSETRRRADITAACEEIAARWPGI